MSYTPHHHATSILTSHSSCFFYPKNASQIFFHTHDVQQPPIKDTKCGQASLAQRQLPCLAACHALQRRYAHILTSKNQQASAMIGKNLCGTAQLDPEVAKSKNNKLVKKWKLDKYGKCVKRMWKSMKITNKYAMQWTVLALIAVIVFAIAEPSQAILCRRWHSSSLPKLKVCGAALDWLVGHFAERKCYIPTTYSCICIVDTNLAHIKSR